MNKYDEPNWMSLCVWLFHELSESELVRIESVIQTYLNTSEFEFAPNLKPAMRAWLGWHYHQQEATTDE